MPNPKLEFSGTEQFAAPPEQVFAAVTDLDKMVNHIPDLQSYERIDEGTLQCVVRPGFSFFRGKANLTIRVLDTKPPESAAMRTEMKGIGQGMTMMSNLQVTPHDEGCTVTWQAQVTEVKGLLVTVPSGLIRGAAEKIVAASWEKVRADVEQ